MKTPLLCMNDVSVIAFGKELISKVCLTINPGEVHVIMGPNGAGKSTLSSALVGHPEYKVSSGTILFKGENLVDLSVEQRALKGLFLSYQNPIEIPGVLNSAFLKASYDAIVKERGGTPLPSDEFEALLIKIMDQVHLKSDMKSRNVNVGFSGGEKKRNEIVQMLLLKPDLAILDEIDSGLDVDGLKTIALAVQSHMNSTRALLIITHYQRLLDYLRPDFVHIMMGGKIVLSGGYDLAVQLEQLGYDAVVGKGR